MSQGLADRKSALRSRFRRRLAALDPPAAEKAARQVADRVLDLPEIQAAHRVFSCLSFDAEINTWDLVRRLLETGREVYVPRTDPATRRLHLHPYPCPLETLSFGLRQPKPDAPELPLDTVDQHIDAALVIGLAFDPAGYRLGHGGGYFDRFLPARPFPTIGLAYELQILDALPRAPHDVPLDIVVTEAAVRRRGS